MTHDPMCMWDENSGSSYGVSKYPCECDLIARVREDERSGAPENWNIAFYQQGYAKGRADALSAAREAVADADCWYATSAAVQVAGNDVRYVVQADALAAIDALRDQE